MTKLKGIRIAVLTVIAVIAGLIGIPFASSGDSEKVVEQISQQGGRVGETDTGAITSVHLVGCEISNSTLEQLEHLRDLTYLDLSSSSVTDEQLGFVGNLPPLQKLYLARTEISDGGLDELRSLRQLRVLDLSHTSVTPAGLVILDDLSALESCLVGGTDISEVELAMLRENYPRCRFLTEP